MSREGVQRDLLPLVEGCTVNTKYGTVKTDHVLFIASGAFHMSKPSDLIPELQGRLPIRVELEPLVVEDFVRILTEPDASLCRQYAALLATEGVELEFEDSGVQRLAEVAFEVNERTENIGARRLHTVMERLLETVSFDAADRSGTRVVIDREYVEGNLGELVARPGSVALHSLERAPPCRSPPRSSCARDRACSTCASTTARDSSCRSNICGCFRPPPRSPATAAAKGFCRPAKRTSASAGSNPWETMRCASYSMTATIRDCTPGVCCTSSARGLDKNWARYLERCAEAGVRRSTAIP